MKINKILVSVFITILGLCFVRCEDQVLEKTPKNSFSEDNIWSDVDLARQYLNEAYSGVGKWGVGGYDNPRQTPSSLVDNTMQRGNHGLWVFNTGQISSSSYGECNRWDWNYGNIKRVNVFLKNISKVPNGTEEEINQLKAQARYIRASCYADLVNWYSWWEGENNGVPLITEPFSLGDDYSAERASYDEVTNFIVNELDAAMQNLPAEWGDENWGRPTKAACLALKSQQLLYAASSLHNPEGNTEEWQKASDAAKAIIDMNQFELVKPVDSYEDYAQIWLNRGNSEIIFARSYHPEYVDENWIDKMNSPNGFTGWGGNNPTQDLVDAYEMADGTAINESGPGAAYDPQNPYENRELRFYANIVYNGRQYRGREVEAYYPAEGATNVSPGIDSRASSVQPWNSSPTGYWWYKFMDESVDFKSGQSDVPLIIFRLAEVYLNYAEAQYHLGNFGEAREYVNKIRTRVNLPEINSSGNQLLQDIRHERRIELTFENNHRWCDVRRWEIVDQTASKDAIGMRILKDDAGNLTYEEFVAQDRNFSEKMYNFPIPFDEIQKSGLKQNPGYN